jgi:hypothetical protein
MEQDELGKRAAAITAYACVLNEAAAFREAAAAAPPPPAAASFKSTLA